MRTSMQLHHCKFSAAVWAVSCFLLFMFCCPAAGGTVPPAKRDGDEIDFATDVAPILERYCVSCHNTEDNEGGFIASTYESLLEGFDNGDVFVANESLQSPLIRLMTGDDEPLMPPDEHPRPTEEEIEIIAKWIDAGAKPPADAVAETMDATRPMKLKVPDLGMTQSNQGPLTAADWSLTKPLIALGSYSRVDLYESGRTFDNDAKPIKSIDDLPGKVNSVRFANQSTSLVIATGVTGSSGKAVLWNFASGEQKSVTGHSDSIYAATLSPDGKTLATASYDRKVILWHVPSMEQRQILSGHNGAIYDLDFSPDSKSLVSASADQTLKVWDVDSGKRLETLGEPLKEQLACRFHPNGRLIYGAGRDNRVRVWTFDRDESGCQCSLKQSVFAHEGPIFAIDLSADGSRLVSTSDDKSVRVWDTSDFRQLQAIEAKEDTGSSSSQNLRSAIAISPDGTGLFLGDSAGHRETITIEAVEVSSRRQAEATPMKIVLSEKGEPKSFNESEPNNTSNNAGSISVPAMVTGKINSDSGSDKDLFSFSAKKGQQLVLEINAARSKSKLDSKLEILNAEGKPVASTLLQAVRESYINFRGKDSDGVDNFRLHNWREMDINNYLYCNGEVVKLFQHPRGPDSGFLVYPGTGKRYGYFGTTPSAHPILAPCYIVESHPPGTKLAANGLPTFPINYENDDASKRDIGKDSRLFFAPPGDGKYIVRVSDVRDFVGDNFDYKLTVRNASPDFNITINAPKAMTTGGGAEFTAVANRIDGFNGPITIDISDVPEGMTMPKSIMIEEGQNRAFGTIHLHPDGDEAINQTSIKGIAFTATAKINGENRVNNLKGLSALKTNPPTPKIELRIVTVGTSVNDAFKTAFEDRPVFKIRPGEMIEAKIVVKRNNHQGRISFGQADAGRNLPHGSYVDDVGLNGLMITEKNVEQVFFITCDHWVKPQVRSFHIRANDVGGETPWPVTIEVLPKKKNQQARN